MTTEIALRPVDVDASLKLQSVSTGLFQSGLYKNVGNAHGAFAVVQYGYELGIGPMMALQNINVIQGKPAASGQLMLSLAMSRGVTFQVEEESENRCAIRFKRGENSYFAEFTRDDAKRAGLDGKDNWRKWPKEMLFWRAVAKGVRRIAPESVMGLYTPDEVSSGGIVDVEHVEAAPAKAEPFKVDLDGLREQLSSISTETGLTQHWKDHEHTYNVAMNFPEVRQEYAARKTALRAGEQKSDETPVVQGELVEE